MEPPRRHNAACRLIVLAVTLVGCTADDGPTARDLFPRPPATRDDTVTVMKMHVAAVEVPVGTTSESTILWGLLNKPVMALDESISLADNGLRVAVGPRDDWHRLEDVLVDMSGQQHVPITVIGIPGAPMPVVVRQHEAPQTVFLVHNDDTLSGTDYPPGQYMLTLLFTIDPDGRSLTVTALPQVESSRHRPVIVRDQGAAAMVHRPITYSLYPLTFRMQLNEGDFILIGPSKEAARETSLGHSFLVTNRGGVPVETILVITPEIVTKQLE